MAGAESRSQASSVSKKPRPKPRQRGPKRSKKVQPVSDSSDDDEDDGASEADSLDIITDRKPGEKTDVETELEKLVFGDADEFKRELREFGDRAEGYDYDEEERRDRDLLVVEEEEAEEGVEGLADRDLFLLDSGPTQNLLTLQPTQEDAFADGGDGHITDAPAWEDSDDERVMVSLATNTRLRKLRTFEGEDVINGREYIKRLRKQFELLNPVPDWARPQRHKSKKARDPMKGAAARRRRRSSANITGDSEQDESAEDESTTLTAAPLAKVLRSSSSLLRKTPHLKNSRPVFRPTTLTILRSRDLAQAADAKSPSSTPIRALQFHPTLPILMLSSAYGRVSLHTLNPALHPPHPAITTLQYQRTSSLAPSQFSPSGSQIYLSTSPARHFHTWTLPTGSIQPTRNPLNNARCSFSNLTPSPCGRHLAATTRDRGVGSIQLLSAATGQWLARVQIEGQHGIADFAWWADGKGLTVANRAGEISEYDVGRRRVVHRWYDEGAVGTTVLALSGDGRVGNTYLRGIDTGLAEALAESDSEEDEEVDGEGRAARRQKPLSPDLYVAIGSTSGIVNIYTRPTTSPGSSLSKNATHPRPYRTLENLTTPISQLTFSPCAQLLAFASIAKKEALRLCHLPSGGTVYRNWPTGRTALGRISAVAMGYTDDVGGGGGGAGAGNGGGGGGNGGGQGPQQVLNLVVGNDRGDVRCWEIRA